MEELISKAKRGDKEALIALILQYRNDLYKIAYGYIKQESDVEDIIQETMIDAFIKMHKLKKAKSFKPWIEKILVNNCKKFYRRKYKREVPMDPENFENIHAPNKLIKTEADIDFELLIKGLDEEERGVLIMYYNREYSTKEIGKILKIKQGTIKSKLSRARKKIREKETKIQEKKEDKKEDKEVI